MHIINKSWERDQRASHKMNLMGTLEGDSTSPERCLVASYWPNARGWEWHIHVFNNVPYMQEHGLCQSEYQTRTAIQHFLDLSV